MSLLLAKSFAPGPFGSSLDGEVRRNACFSALSLTAWFLAALAAAAVPCRAELMTFHIGNSLTNQLLGPGYTTRLQNLSLAEGANALRANADIRPNQNLSGFVAEPVPAGSTSPRYQSVFAGSKIDALFLQPWYGATVRQEVEAAKELIRQMRLNPLNEQARILIYSTWGSHSLEQPFRATWPLTNVTLDTNYFAGENTIRIFMEELHKTVPEAELIPAGRVFYEIADRLYDGLVVPGIPTFEHLYVDSVHASNAGSYAACLAAYSVIYSKSPVGLGYPAQMLDPAYGYVLPEEGQWPLQSLVAEVVAVPEPSGLRHVGHLIGLAGAWHLLRRRPFAFMRAASHPN